MKKLEITEKFRAYSENEAKDFIEQNRAAALKEGYVIKKAGYEYKTKKAKGEIVDEAWITTIVKTFNSIWEEDDNG